MSVLRDFYSAVLYGINEAKREWKRRAWLRHNRASASDLPF